MAVRNNFKSRTRPVTLVLVRLKAPLRDRFYSHDIHLPTDKNQLQSKRAYIKQHLRAVS